MNIKKIITKQNDWLLWFFGIGIIGHLWQQTRESMVALTPLAILSTTIYTLVVIRKELNAKLAYWCSGVFILAILVDLVGVSTRTLFGPYRYGEVLGLYAWGVSLTMSIVWFVVMFGTAQLSQQIIKNTYARVIGSAVLAGIFYFILIPVGAELGYWRWLVRGVPIQTYIIWSVFAIICVSAYNMLKIKIKNTLPRDYFIALFIFFTVLRVVLLWQ